MMKTLGALLQGERDLKMVERELVLNDDEVLVKVHQASICDADLRAYRGLHMPNDLPVFDYIGHEGGGTIVEVGSKVREFKIGDKVMLFGPHNSLANYFKANVDNVHKAPEGLDMRIACLGEPLCVGMYGIVETDVQLGDTVVVVGLNFQGQLAVQALKKRGAGKVIAVDYSDKHLEIAKEVGADVLVNTTKVDALSYIKEITNGRLCDVGFHSCGYWNSRYQEYFNLTRELTRDEGTMVSVPDMMSPLDNTSFHRIHHHALTIKFPAVMHHNPSFRKIWVPKLMRMVMEGKIDVNPLITGVYNMNQVLEAMGEFDSNEDQVKIILEA